MASSSWARRVGLVVVLPTWAIPPSSLETDVSATMTSAKPFDRTARSSSSCTAA